MLSIGLTHRVCADRNSVSVVIWIGVADDIDTPTHEARRLRPEISVLLMLLRLHPLGVTF